MRGEKVLGRMQRSSKTRLLAFTLRAPRCTVISTGLVHTILEQFLLVSMKFPRETVLFYHLKMRIARRICRNYRIPDRICITGLTLAVVSLRRVEASSFYFLRFVNIFSVFRVSFTVNLLIGLIELCFLTLRS